jgi:hypothetical protein
MFVRPRWGKSCEGESQLGGFSFERPRACSRWCRRPRRQSGGEVLAKQQEQMPVGAPAPAIRRPREGAGRYGSCSPRHFGCGMFVRPRWGESCEGESRLGGFSFERPRACSRWCRRPRRQPGGEVLAKQQEQMPVGAPAPAIRRPREGAGGHAGTPAARGRGPLRLLLTAPLWVRNVRKAAVGREL